MFRYSKYNNKKVEVDGIKFDSKKEANFYLTLKNLLEEGDIRDLELQKEYILQHSFKINNKARRKITYTADFTFYSTHDNKIHVMDVKGCKTDVYKLKKKLFEYKYGIEIEEV